MKSSFYITLIWAVGLIFVQAETREWTSSDGKKIEATIISLDGEMVRLETVKGNFELPLSRLSNPDQDFAKEWAEKKKAAEMAASAGGSGDNVAPLLGDFENLKLGVWPQFVVADLEVVEIDPAESAAENKGEYVYRTPHFEFHSPDRLSISVTREFARIFEATFAFVEQMPIGLAPKGRANGYYQTILYMTEDAYYLDGGMPGSGGMFSWRSRGEEMNGMIKVPLSNLGVEFTGNRFIVDQNKRSTTLTHEIVHQVMMRWLATSMPTWLSEGIAEVVSSQSYDGGRFKLSSMNRSIADEVSGGSGEFRMVKLERLMTISHEDWAAELAGGNGGHYYNSANVLAYYFLRLDGEGNGANLVEFLKEITKGNRADGSTEAQATFLLRDRDYEKLEVDLARAWRSEGLKVEFN